MAEDVSGTTTTLGKTLTSGPVVSRGRVSDYRRLVAGPGDPRVLRSDLGGELAPAPAGDSLLHVAQLTDLQIADVQSPGRIEFLEAVRGLPGEDIFVPVARPQEALAAHAFDAAVRTINHLQASLDGGRSIDLVVSTGDGIDNAQGNELNWFFKVLAGGALSVNSGGSSYEGVQAVDWDLPVVWHPDGASDHYRDLWGFPSRPGLLDIALRQFDAEGLRLPWLCCYGNHEGLVGGISIPSEEYEHIVLGDRKPTRLPDGVDPIGSAEKFYVRPELYLSGPGMRVTADPARASATRRDFVHELRRSPGKPAGHGLSSTNERDGTAYGCHDTTAGRLPVRLVMLDTTNLDGESEAMTSGSIGSRQATWLTERLLEVHSAYWDTEGHMRRTGNPDSVVVLLSHHGPSSLSPSGTPPRGVEEDAMRVPAAGLMDLIHGFPNVVLWLSGHEHRNRITPRPDPLHRSPGFWEVTTSAIVDWPCQLRLVELLLDGLGQLQILTTMVDLDVPVAPMEEPATHTTTLASLLRELAANDPFGGGRDPFFAHARGGPEDRNTLLVRPWDNRWGQVK